MTRTLWRRPQPRSRLLIVRHRKVHRHFYDIILRWVEANLPDLRPLFDVRDLPAPIWNWSPYALHVAWLQDPVQQWCPKSYRQAVAIARQCDRRGIPVLNRVDRLANAAKSRGAETLRAAGLHTPRMAPIHDRREFEQTLLGLNLPLFVRDDWGHERNLFRVDAPADLARIPWENYQRPVAIEVVDIRDPRDGLYRKYRYLAAGDVGVSHHLQTSAEWITRGENREFTPEARDEELAYIAQPDPNHELLQRARRALNLDLVAFDYGYAPDGRMIVWEANPFPHIVFATQRLTYRNPAIHRTLLAIVRMYLAAAGMRIPPEIDAGLALDLDGVAATYTANFPPHPEQPRSRWPRFLPRRAA